MRRKLKAWALLPPTLVFVVGIADSEGDIVASTRPSAMNNIAKRYTMPTMAWEGLTVLPTGVVIGGDEERPGSAGADADGGAIFKFVPDVPRLDDSQITDLAKSPRVSGNSYAWLCDRRSSDDYRL